MSKMQMEAVVKDVEVRVVNRRDGSGQMTVYDLVLSDGSKWTAFERHIAEQAYALRGQPITLEVVIKQNGNYTNKNVNAVLTNAPAGTFPTNMTATNSLGALGGTSSTAVDMFTPSPTGTNIDPAEERKNLSIHRQVATKVAAALSPTSETDFWANVEVLMNFYQTGQKPNILNSLIENGQVTVGVGQGIDDDIPF